MSHESPFFPPDNITIVNTPDGEPLVIGKNDPIFLKDLTQPKTSQRYILRNFLRCCQESARIHEVFKPFADNETEAVLTLLEPSLIRDGIPPFDIEIYKIFHFDEITWEDLFSSGPQLPPAEYSTVIVFTRNEGFSANFLQILAEIDALENPRYKINYKHSAIFFEDAVSFQNFKTELEKKAQPPTPRTLSEGSMYNRREAPSNLPARSRKTSCALM